MGQTSSSSQVDYTFGIVANKPNQNTTATSPYNQKQVDHLSNSNNNNTNNIQHIKKDERLLLYPQHYGLVYDIDESDDDDKVQQERLSFPSSSSSSCSLPLTQQQQRRRSSYYSTLQQQKQHIDRIDSGYADQDVFFVPPKMVTLNERLAKDILYVDQLYYADSLPSKKQQQQQQQQPRFPTLAPTLAYTSNLNASNLTAGIIDGGNLDDDDDEFTIGTKLTFAAAALASQDASMREICLSRRSLISLSPNIGLLTSIRKLDLCNNQLVDLPDSIGQLKQLEILTISKNQLQHLPNTLQCLSRLTELDLSYNQLQHLPSLGHFSVLNTLLLSHNQLTSIPSDLAGMKRLVTMDLSYNPLSVLPAEMTRLSHLRRLRLDHCHQLLNHEQHQAMEYTLTHDPPSLMEICARNVVSTLSTTTAGTTTSSRKGKFSIKSTRQYASPRITTQKLTQLPNHLLSYLASVKVCSSCHGPYFDTHVVRRRLIEKNDLWIPLEYRLCSAHWSDENDRLLNMFHREKSFLHNNVDMVSTVATLYTLACHQEQEMDHQLPTTTSSLCMDDLDMKTTTTAKVAFLRHPQRLQRVMNKNPSSFLLHKMQRG
ncbi:uncharacterized protein BX664DRAFT_277084 [Halteromyces radiatus]|uniref:uncharacterized protein n=1 Tax=Halteromyces radiatus TaxID=101107 RepID=UPI002220C4A0|nr:uncharacterized protein BX664DRAFT_277084 [Halteromyces radiatus]KAI8092675.1 hypothetical protein BX664DRAFT_277084 [Halteromyces radiatus]